MATESKTGESVGATIASRVSGDYEDNEFPAAEVSIGKLDDPVEARWLRPRDFVPGTPHLISDGVAAGDVCQGGLGDCWFLGGLAVVASRPDLFRKVIAYNGVENGKGMASFNFYKFGEIHEIVVDDRLPVNETGPVFANGKDPQELWCALMEKAYAKLHGSYSALVGGWTNDALVDLTGGVPDTIFFEDDEVKPLIADGRFWQRLLRMHRSGNYLLGCARSTSGTREADTGRGILQGHAYSIIDVREVSVGGETHNLVRCRNPWGCSEWKGDWSDSDARWTPELLSELDYSLGNDGTFWIGYPDFITEYNKVYVAHLIEETWHKVAFKNRWAGSSAGGCANNASWVNNPQYQLVLFERTDVVVSIQQRDPRQIPGKSRGEHIGVVLLNADPDEKSRHYSVAAKSDISNLRELVIEETLDAGVYNVVPFTFEAGVETEYFLTVFGSQEFKLTSFDGHSPAVGSAPVPARDLPPLDPSRRPIAPVEPVVIAKRDRAPDDPGIVGAIVKMVMNQLGERFPGMKDKFAMAGDMAVAYLAKGGGGKGGKGCCTVM